MSDKSLTNWKKATQELAQAFADKYYNTNEEFTIILTKEDWVYNEIGGVLFICDDFYVVDRMREALELNATQEQVFSYSDYENNLKSDKRTVNFRNYVKYNFALD